MDYKKDKDVCIIGAGISGLTAGALLTKLGYRVVIYERESYLGGRALSFPGSSVTYKQYTSLLNRFCMHIPFSEPDLKLLFEKKLLHGYQLDLGYHAIGGGVLSNVNSILSKINAHIEILESNVGFITDPGFEYPFLSKTDKLRILPYIFRLLTASERTMKKLDTIAMDETIRRYGKGKMKLILELFSRSITTVNNLERISTGEMFRSQKNLLRGSKPVGYPKQGLVSIHKKLADYIIKNGGAIHLKKPVTKILIEQKKAVGVSIKNARHYFSHIVSTILVQNLCSLVDESLFPKGYITHLNSLKGTGSLCAYYSIKHVDDRLLGKTFHFLERNVGVDGNDAVGMIDFMSSMPDSKVSPPSQYLVQSYIICTPEEAKNKSKLKQLKTVLDSNLERLIPQYHSQLRWALYPAIWHLDGVAKTIDNRKPEINTPIDNFYLIGDCVKAPGVGVNCALNSARKLAEMFASL
jgi:hypothetical protein